MVDITKPLIPQVKKMTNKEFMAFVRRPRYIDSQDGIQLFEDKEHDEHMKRGYWPNVAVLLPIVFAFIALAFVYSATKEDFCKHFLIYFGAGCGLMWTYTEYFFHRHMLHREVLLDPEAEADGEYNASCFSQHLHHHVFMNQYYRIVLNSATYYQFAAGCVAGISVFQNA